MTRNTSKPKSNSMPLDWHRTNIENRRAYLQKQSKAIANLQTTVDRMRVELDEYELQLAKAEAEGVDRFDAAKYGKKRKNV